MTTPSRHCIPPLLSSLGRPKRLIHGPPSMTRLAVKQYTTSGSQTIQSDEKAHSASSSDASRYFGNRTHKKICSGCGLPNLLPAPRCIACGTAVSDRDIRPVGQHDPLIEAVMVAKPTLAAKLKQNYRPQRLSRLFAGSMPSRVWHADFDTLVMDCPWPSSTSGHHVLGIIKSSRSYDIRCLNRRHVQLLDRLHAQCVEALRRSLVADKALSTEVAVELLKQAQFGFRYPSEFSVISLHGLCPPFEPNLGIFAPPHWMSFKAVREVVGKSGKITDVSACLPSSSVVGSLPKALVEAQDIGTRLVKGSNS